MNPDGNESARRLLVCLVADEHVIDRFPNALRYLQVGLIDESIDVVLIVPESSRAQSLTLGPTAVITHRAASWPLSRLGWRGVITEVQRRIDAITDEPSVVIHCLAGSAAPLAAEIAAATGSDLLLSISSTNEFYVPQVAPCLHKAAALITPSWRIQQALKASPFAQKTIEVIPLGTTIAHTPAALSAPQLAPALVFAGDLSPDCGVDALLRAAKHVLQHHPRLLVFIVGKGPAESRLRHLAHALDIHQAVTFTGRLEHWRHVLEAADIFCMPRAGTTFREEPVHAIAAGMAIAAAENTPYDGLTHEETALLFPDGDETQMAEQILRFLDQPDFTRTVAATAQAYARSHHSVARMVSEHVRIYRQLQSRGSTYAISSAP